MKPPRDFKAFASRLVMDNGKPLRVQGFQADFIADVDAGVPECWLVIPEGNGKTTLLAAFALYHVSTVPFASVVVAASTRDQAMLLYRQAKGFVLRSGLEGFICQDGTRRIKFAAELEGKGRKRSNYSESLIQIFAAEAGGADGVIPTLGIIDEPHRLKGMDLYLTWSGKLGKRAGQLVAISTAGEPGSEFELIREQIRQAAKVVERDKGAAFGRFVSESVVLHEWAVPEDGDVDDLALVKAANPLPSITKTSLRRKREKPTMTLAHWKRFTCNMPTRSDLAAITEREWFEAQGEPIPDGAPVWAGLDVGWKYDPTAIVPLWVGDDPDDRRLGAATILEPPTDGTGLDLYAVERALAELNDRHPIEAVVMDVTDARDVADWLESELGVNVLERSQGLKSQIEDYDRFTEALRNGWLSHVGDRGLTVHALNAIARILPSGKYVFGRPVASRMAKHQDMRRIDALVASAMVHTARTATSRSVYDTRGMVAV